MIEEHQTKGSLEAARVVAENRSSRARQLKNEGKKVMGYFCSYMPLEILMAAGFVPFRIQGNLTESITRANAYLDPSICNYLKSCYDMVLKDEYDFLDGWVTPDSCDSKIALFKVWTYNVESPYVYWLNVPNFLDEECFRFLREELTLFRNSLEEHTQVEISDDKLYEAIDLRNAQRALLRELYHLRKPDSPLIYGSEVMQVLLAVTGLPVEGGNQLLEDVVAEVKERRDGPGAGQKRLLLYGPEIDNPSFFKLVEDCGGNVVIDDACVGTRWFWHDVEKTANPLDGLTDRYLRKNMCPRTIRGRMEGWSTRQADLDERFGHIWQFAKEFSAEGIILYVMKYCDLHEYDIPDLRDYLTEKGLPVLHIEADYSMAAVMGLKTRIEAFLEMIH